MPAYHMLQAATPTIANRYDLVRYCGGLGCKVFAEIGVLKGKFSKWILEALPDVVVYSIDQWRTVDGQFMRDAFLFAVGGLGQFPGRSRVIVAPSPQIAELFADGSLDFCYIDGDHRLECVRADLAAWWPKVRRGGVMAGDDWGETRDGGPALEKQQLRLPQRLIHSHRMLWQQYRCGVMQAVTEFVEQHDLDLQVTTDDTKRLCPQWWFRKP